MDMLPEHATRGITIYTRDWIVENNKDDLFYYHIDQVRRIISDCKTSKDALTRVYRNASPYRGSEITAMKQNGQFYLMTEVINSLSGRIDGNELSSRLDILESKLAELNVAISALLAFDGSAELTGLTAYSQIQVGLMGEDTYYKEMDVRKAVSASRTKDEAIQRVADLRTFTSTDIYCHWNGARYFLKTDVQGLLRK